MKTWRDLPKATKAEARPLLCFGCLGSLGGYKMRPTEKTAFGAHIHRHWECRMKALQRFLRERGISPPKEETPMT